MKSNSVLTTVVALFILVAANAQPYQIRTVNKGAGVVGVEMRVTGGSVPTTATSITDLVFGIKWLSTYNVDLVNTISTTYNIKKSDVRKQKNQYYYQAFFVDNTPMNFPANWTLNNWVEIMSIANTRTGLGTGDFEIVETGFDITTNPNIGVNLIEYTPQIAGNATEVLLPLKLLSFSASSNQCNVSINWKTSEEVNVLYFALERSINNAAFNEITRDSPGPDDVTIKTYETVDNGAPTGNIAYRLRITNNDGKNSYSPIKQVNLRCGDKNGFVVYPTLSSGIVHVKLPTGYETSTIRVIDTNGKQVAVEETKSLNRTLNLHTLATGSYIIQVVSNRKVVDNTKIVLQ